MSAKKIFVRSPQRLETELSPVKKLINILLNTKNKREERDIRLMERGEDPFFFTIKMRLNPD